MIFYLVDLLQRFLLQRLGISPRSPSSSHVETPEKILSDLSLKGVADYMKSDKCKPFSLSEWGLCATSFVTFCFGVVACVYSEQSCRCYPLFCDVFLCLLG